MRDATQDRERGKAHEADVEILRAAFLRGQEFTRDSAQRLLGIPDRRFRAAVAALRDDGMPVVSWSQEDSTYRMAHDIAEANRFVAMELVPRLRNLEREARRIRERAPSYFRPEQQRLV